MTHDLSEFSYTERMLYLILNTDETFELRWIDYYTISGFDEVMAIEEGLEPPVPKNLNNLEEIANNNNNDESPSKIKKKRELQI